MRDEYDGFSPARAAIEIIRIANHVIGLLDSAAERHMARMRGVMVEAHLPRAPELADEYDGF